MSAVVAPSFLPDSVAGPSIKAAVGIRRQVRCPVYLPNVLAMLGERSPQRMLLTWSESVIPFRWTLSPVCWVCWVLAGGAHNAGTAPQRALRPLCGAASVSWEEIHAVATSEGTETGPHWPQVTFGFSPLKWNSEGKASMPQLPALSRVCQDGLEPHVIRELWFGPWEWADLGSTTSWLCPGTSLSPEPQLPHL